MGVGTYLGVCLQTLGVGGGGDCLLELRTDNCGHSLTFLEQMGA